MINKHKSNKIKENSNTVRHLNDGTDHHHSKSCCDQSSPARRTMTAAHLSSIMNVKKVFVVITNFINNLAQYHLVRLIAKYTSILRWSFQICSHIHPKSFHAGLNVYDHGQLPSNIKVTEHVWGIWKTCLQSIVHVFYPEKIFYKWQYG